MSVAHQKAETAIAIALRDLELATGEHVKAVEIVNMEATNITSTRPHWLRTVRVSTTPIPGSDWGQA